MADAASISDFTRTRATAEPLRASQSQPDLRFSVVMPSYGHAQYIERSLLSVLNQGYPGTQLIVVDGGSKDDTVPILERYAGDLDFWCSERDGGQSDALNKGFRRANGDIFGWLNSDDVYVPGAFEHAAEVFRAHPAVQVVYGDWYTIDPDDRVSERYLGLSYSRGQLITEGFFCNAQSMFWRRALHEKFGEFDVRLHYTMDYDLMLRMSSIAGRGAFFRTNRALGAFRVYAGQKTGSANDKVEQEHRLIAARSGVSWKYGLAGRTLRTLFRGKRVAEYVLRGRADYLLSRVRARTLPRSLT